ncbi:MAG: DNA methyltransferase [Chloracidobacterium sp.]
MSPKLEKLKSLLAELFQLDQSELDFGMYRIMNAKRDEITRFLDHDLLPQVRQALGQYEQDSRAAIAAELEKAKEQAKSLGFDDPMQAPRVKELQVRYNAAFDLEAAENDVFSHLYNFFRRYYQEGDFISQRRYKEGVYAIPYEGEEVKLYWANHDQYYTKTSEHLRNYTFKLSCGKRVHFKLVEADTEKDNNRAPNGNERRFVLGRGNGATGGDGETGRRGDGETGRRGDGETGRQGDVWDIINDELVLYFRYVPDPARRKQADLNADAVKQITDILREPRNRLTAWLPLLETRPTAKNPKRTLLEKHLTDYTARNTFDYFIHKDLGGFLRRELDFYIKNEVMQLDDIENETAPRVEQYLSKIKAIRRIAHKVIDFLAQLENFQKKLWLKKKFVVETQYCITLDRILAIEDAETRDLLVKQIIENDAQCGEWKQLYGDVENWRQGDKASGSLFEDDGVFVSLSPRPHVPSPHVPGLRVPRSLMVDTRHFDESFKLRLLAAIPDIDEETDGLLIHSENFQVLNLLQEKYRESIRAIYIDPPYNTFATKIVYKNEYEHSSWLSFIENRLLLARHLLARNGIACTTIDDYELHRFLFIMESVFGPSNQLATVPIRNNPSGRSTVKGFAINHEYGLFFCRSSEETTVGRMPHTEAQRARYDENDDEGNRFEWENFRKSSSGSYRSDRPRQYFPLYFDKQTSCLRIPSMEWQDQKQTWNVLENPKDSESVIWPKDSAGKDRVWRYGIERTLQILEEAKVREEAGGNFQVYTKKYLQAHGSLPRTWWDKAEYSARDNGTQSLADLFGPEKLFDFPKSPAAVVDSIRVCAPEEGVFVLDFFAGSGTTGHAVINLNREDGGRRKFILVEMAEYFDTVLVLRLKKVTFTPEWKDGKPKRMPTPEEIARGPRIMKVIRLESYEDTLNNLELKRAAGQQSLLDQHAEFREDYMLRYMLDVESRGSASLLDLERFDEPFNYKLDIATGTVGETKPTVVDLVETFNYLIGLRVKTVDHIRGVRVVTGTNPQGERVLILWRNTKDMGNDKLDEWFRKQSYNTQDQEFDVIYVNGDNNLENLRKPDQTWKVRLTEEEFRRLMFDVADV